MPKESKGYREVKYIIPKRNMPRGTEKIMGYYRGSQFLITFVPAKLGRIGGKVVLEYRAEFPPFIVHNNVSLDTWAQVKARAYQHPELQVLR